MGNTTNILRDRPLGELDVDLSTEDVRMFEEHGYLPIERITTEDEIAWLGRIYDELFQEKQGGTPGGYFDLSRPYDSEGPNQQPQLLLPEKVFPALLETCFQRNGRRIAARLLGEDPDRLHVGGHMILKPARHGSELPWHQDEAYWDPGLAYEAVGVWMPLDEATLESGCLQFIPGSHRADVLPHHHVGGDPTVHALEADEVDPDTAVAVPIAAGGAVVHHCRTLHYSGPNRSGNVRRAYTNEFQAPPQQRTCPAYRPWLEQTREAWARRSIS